MRCWGTGYSISIKVEFKGGNSMKKIIDLNDNIIKTIEDELVEGLGLRAIKFQHVELDEIGVVSFVFDYPTSQSITGWKTATYPIGVIEEE